ncbi:MAG: hypothetical protein GY861_18105 [bacterium]|nr:hypothetical protein [bacterium]
MLIKHTDGKVYELGNEIKSASYDSQITMLESIKGLTEEQIVIANAMLQGKGKKTFGEFCQEQIDTMETKASEINSLK